MPFVSLLQSTDLEHIAEMQWRMSVPMATIMLAILAVPLAAQPPRGPLWRMAIGLLVFIIYLNMLSAAKAWIEQGDFAAARILVGAWCVVSARARHCWLMQNGSSANAIR